MNQAESAEGTMSGHCEQIYDCREIHADYVSSYDIWLCSLLHVDQPMPVSNVPNSGSNVSNSHYRGFDDDNQNEV